MDGRVVTPREPEWRGFERCSSRQDVPQDSQSGEQEMAGYDAVVHRILVRDMEEVHAS